MAQNTATDVPSTPQSLLTQTPQGGYLNMVMEHCRYGELASFIQHRAAANRLLSEDEVMFM